jgi:hypothetical protein
MPFHNPEQCAIADPNRCPDCRAILLMFTHEYVAQLAAQDEHRHTTRALEPRAAVRRVSVTRDRVTDVASPKRASDKGPLVPPPDPYASARPQETPIPEGNTPPDGYAIALAKTRKEQR